MILSQNGPLTLMYHRIGVPRRRSAASVHYVSPSAFAWQLSALQKLHMEVIDLSAVAEHVNGATPSALTSRHAAITFDDGFDHLYENALPVLKRYGFPATIFVVSQFIGKASDFDPPAWDREPLLSENRLREMHAFGVTIGSHTRRHPRLPDCDPETLRDEISGSREDLETLLQTPVKAFCYPFGAQNQSVRAVVKEAGYDFACSTQKGRNDAGVDPFLLRRIHIRADTTRMIFLYKIWRARLLNR
ncbi:MAG TPA: polysaccharide deacetylase family protein [Armatimonadota bacterium]|nr:polysaccharide deacetylase family protein [Armatimonadota bacterium]